MGLHTPKTLLSYGLALSVTSVPVKCSLVII